MKNITHLFILIFFGLYIYPTNAQDNPKLCVLFTSDTKYITIEIYKDSSQTDFQIISAGFETKEERKKKLEKLREYLSQYALTPSATIDLYTVKKPFKVSSLKALGCPKIITVGQYRGAVAIDSTIVDHTPLYDCFIKKVNDSTYLVWDRVRSYIRM